MTEAQHQEDLKKLQDDIYREKVLRARMMTPEEKLEASFLLSDDVMKQMLAGAMWQLDTEDIEEGWTEVRRRLDRLDALHDHQMYVTKHKSAI